LKKIFFLIFVFISFSCNDSGIVDPDFKEGSLSVISISIKSDHYTELIENKLLEAFVPAEMKYNNKIYRVHLSPQGAGSRYYPKFGLKITCEDGDVKGIREFNLNAQISDNLMMRTTLSTHLYRQMGFPVFYSEAVFLKINNEDKGLFLLTEKIDEDYFIRRNEKVFELMKTVFDAKFTFEGKNNPEATFEKKIPDDNNFSNLSQFIHTLDTVSIPKISSALGKHLDIENYLNYHLLTSVMNNTDGLSNNFYFYKKHGNSPYQIIPWDFDKSFNLKFSVGVSGDNHIIKKILQHPDYKNYYNNLLKIVGDYYMTESNLFPVIDSCYTKIKPFYHRDPYLQNSSESFEERVEKLKEFIVSQRKMIKDSKIN